MNPPANPLLTNLYHLNMIQACTEQSCFISGSRRFPYAESSLFTEQILKSMIHTRPSSRAWK